MQAWGLSIDSQHPGLEWASEIPALMWRQETKKPRTFYLISLTKLGGSRFSERAPSQKAWVESDWRKCPVLTSELHTHGRICTCAHTYTTQAKNNNIKSILRTKPQNYFERFLVLHQHSTLEALTWGSQASGFPASLPLHLIDKWHAN